MPLPPFKKQPARVEDQEALETTLRQIQDAIDDALRRVLGVPLLDGVLLSGITITGAGATFEHKLGRQPVGFVVTDRTGGAEAVQRSAAGWDERTIGLIVDSGTFTGDLWVF